ncbi:DNA cytosine methyltransferase [Muricauda sp. SCSIO 64092]|uniref:DNA cytosine methyltransferase n=1 Tax=Allomuricauda sp. SCSIO 64092 TaxID=2908842 RepID=UPI001FF497DD|nr:DNA cytosine methyltransferase [Muricauda sp. SCSIO 64092]UOY08306.1 DNA cytosine methyltransferase [Muricauda sp. SCSIO 64092]
MTKTKSKTNNAKILKAVDFFCGAGGVTYGFRKAKIKVLGGIDIDPRLKETYEINNKGAQFIQADISKLSFNQLSQRLSVLPNEDDLIFIGCSPCQYFTTIQTEKEKSKKTRMLLVDFQRFVDYFRPGYIVVENVPGLETKKDSPLQHFKTFLTENGYSFDDRVINAVKYNVPQKRKRYLLLATRVQSEITIPNGRNQSRLTVRNFIGDKTVFKPVKAGNKDNTDFNHTVSGLKEINLKRIRKTPPDGGTRLAWKDDPDLQLNCYKGNDNLFYDVYGRMHWDKPAPTITTKFNSITNGRYGHPEQDRAISIREGAVLQTFPLHYKFKCNSMGTAAKMIGNAVPPELARWVGKTIVQNAMNGAV